MSALPSELAHVLAATQASQDSCWGPVGVYSGAFHHAPVVAVACGIGKVQASAATQFVIARYQPAVVLFIGAAGALHPALQPGHVVIGARLIEHDFDSRALAKRPQDYHVRQWDPDPALVKEVAAAAERAVGPANVGTGTILTGDQCIVDPQQRGRLRETYGGDCVEMEGAAVAAVCRHNGTPYAIVRIVSDAADRSARRQFIKQLDSVGVRAGRIVEAYLQASAGDAEAPAGLAARGDDRRMAASDE